MKYITTKSEEGKLEIFTFPNDINHNAMAEVLCRIRNKTYGDWKRIDRVPVSAGFVARKLLQGAFA